MAAYTRKQYSGAARNTTTTTLLTNVGTTVDITATTGWPAIAGIPFYVVINPSSIFEEKCLATISGSTLTLVRAQDDTTSSEHPIGSIIYPVFTANDADEANELVSKLTTAGDLLTTDGTNLLRLGVGPNGYFLKASSSASAGIEWASIPTINSLDDIGDVTITAAADGEFLAYDSSASVWINQSVQFITVSDNPPTTGVEEGDLWYNSLELELYTYYSGAWVQTTDSGSGVQEIYELVDVLIDNPVSGESLVYNGTEWENGPAGSALTLENSRVISLSGDVSGSVSFDGSQNVNIATNVGNADTATSLETARTISLDGDLSGSASFNGTSDITINATVVNSGVSLDEISDVVITSPLQFQGLMYDGTNWVNSNIPDAYLVRNNTGSTILKGTLVGAVGAEPSGRIDVAPFQVTGTENSELRAMGIATSNISSGVNGEVMSFGTLTGLDTRGSTASALAVGDETWAAGDILFAHPTVDGKLTNVRPQHDLAVAFITVRHASTGQIAIRIIPGNNHLEWMHDVSLVDKTSGDFLKYNGTLWVNDQINLGTDTTGNYMSDLTQGTGVTITHTPSEGSNATIAIGQAVGTSASVTFANINATGNLVVGGDLTVNGTTTTLNTETLEIEDNIIVLNSNVSASPVLDAGIEIERGTSPNVFITWNESLDKWQLTNDGAAYYDILTHGNNIDDLAYVKLTDPVAGEFLSYDGGDWVNSQIPAINTLNEIGDVSIGLNIGDTGPAGGKIFITPDTTGNTTGLYFEAAPSASQVQRSWATGGNQSSAVSGADGTAIGTGSQNTIDIVAQSGNVSATSAAVYASGYEYNGFSDWFLPSIDELQEIYANESSVDGVLSDNYWSSTEYSATQAEYQNLGDGGQAFSAKSNSLYVRPVRAFSSPASGDFLKWNGSYWTNDPTLPTVSVSNSFQDNNSASMIFTGVEVDSYGRVTGRTAATHRLASITAPGIIQFDDDKFDYSDGPFTIKANGIELGADTTGNYMVNVSASTGISISHTPGEGSNATIAIGQAVATTSSVTFANVTSTGNVSISGRIDKTTIRESVADTSVSASVVTADYATGDIFYVGTAPGSNFTVNLTNAPTDNGKAITVVIFVTQGATGYIPNAVQVAGSAQTIKWANGAAPTPTSSAGKIDIFSFTFVRRSSAWTVFGSSNLGY